MLLTSHASHFADLPPERMRLLVTAFLVALIVHVVMFLAVWQTWGKQPVLPSLPPLEIALVSPALQNLIQPAPAVQSPPVVQTPPVSKNTLSQPAQKTPVLTRSVQEVAATPARQTEAVSPPVISSNESSVAPAPEVSPVKAEPVLEATPPSFDAAYLNNPKPDYPLAAKRMGMEGIVLLRVVVNPAGIPEKVSILNSSGVRLLDEAAVNTVYQWTFIPARQGGKAVSGSVNVPIRFAID